MKPENTAESIVLKKIYITTATAIKIGIYLIPSFILPFLIIASISDEKSEIIDKAPIENILNELGSMDMSERSIIEKDPDEEVALEIVPPIFCNTNKRL